MGPDRFRQPGHQLARALSVRQRRIARPPRQKTLQSARQEGRPRRGGEQSLLGRDQPRRARAMARSIIGVRGAVATGGAHRARQGAIAARVKAFIFCAIAVHAGQRHRFQTFGQHARAHIGGGF
jgi:hypothetical protein